MIVVTSKGFSASQAIAALHSMGCMPSKLCSYQVIETLESQRRNVREKQGPREHPPISARSSKGCLDPTGMASYLSGRHDHFFEDESFLI